MGSLGEKGKIYHLTAFLLSSHWRKNSNDGRILKYCIGVGSGIMYSFAFLYFPLDLPTNDMTD